MEDDLVSVITAVEQKLALKYVCTGNRLVNDYATHMSALDIDGLGHSDRGRDQSRN